MKLFGWIVLLTLSMTSCLSAQPLDMEKLGLKISSTKPIEASPVECLQVISPSPIPIVSWPIDPRKPLKQDVLNEYVRISRVYPIFAWWYKPECIKQGQLTNPEYVAIVLSPFHDEFEGLKFSDDEATVIDTRLQRYYVEVYRRLKELYSSFPNKKFFVIYDFERHWPIDDPIVHRKLRAFSFLAINVIPDCEVIWYNFRSRFTLLNGNQKWNSPVPINNFPCAYASTSLYYYPTDWANWDCAFQTQTSSPNLKFAPWVSIGSHWGRNQHKWKRSWCWDCNPRLGDTWHLGRKVASEADVICVWPYVFYDKTPHFLDHFIAFMNGVHGEEE